ncbi:MAG: T9SS type A sorting domain-containing protein, partial [Phaeodactylibacter sp.]|nr:T9SS type A sorting domain-containing protein [Phaeodactylibacter sp.]
TDNNGNSSSCNATVTVEDNVPPMAVCQNITVQLGDMGTASITSNDIGGGTTDACGISFLMIDIDDFSCDDVGSDVEVTLMAIDVNSNVSNCTAFVTVEDNVAPAAFCKDWTAYLEQNGLTSIDVGNINAGSTDACGIFDLSLDQTEFSCDNLEEPVTVTLTVTDVNGNSSTCTARVFVEDELAPDPVCLTNTIYITGNYELEDTDVLDFGATTDNCNDFFVSAIDAATITCLDEGETFEVPVTVSDGSGNTANCTATITVEVDNSLPEPWASADIGNPGTGNTYQFDPCNQPPVFTVEAGAANNSLGSDNIAFIGQELCGDVQITVKVESITPNGYAGLMMRETDDPGSKMVGLYSNLTNIVRWETRTVTDANKSVNFFNKPLPYWLRLQRQGNWITALYSYNGVGFSFVTAQQVPMEACIEIGLAAYSNIPGETATAVFSNVGIQGGEAPLAILPGNSVEPGSVSRNISLFPNPTRAMVTLEFGPEAVSDQDNQTTVRLRNELGQLIEVRQIEEPIERMDWDVSQLSPGLYFIEVFTEGQAPQLLRFVRAE